MKDSDILIRLRQIIRSVNLESKRIEKIHGISIPQLLCLIFLNDSDNFQASHKEIKDFLKLNASTVTGIIGRLEKKGYVARLPKKGDRRIATVSITSSGAALVKETPEPLHEQLSSKLKKLTNEELAKLAESFDTITNFLNIEDLDASPIITAQTEINKEL